MIKTATLLAVGIVGAAHAHDFKPCTGAPGDLKITTVTLNPDPPQKGKNLDVTVDMGPLKEAITGGKIKLDVLIHGTRLTGVDFDLCKDTGLNCPVEAGTSTTAKVSYTIPNLPIPPIPLTIDTTFEDASGAELDCVELTVKIGAALRAALLDGDTMALQALEEFDGSLTPDQARFLYEAWKNQFPHVQIDDDEYRLGVFKDNMERIIDHNMNNKVDDYKMGMNEFGHLTWNEFRKQYVGTGLRPDLLSNQDVPRDTHVAAADFAPRKGGVDWAAKGAVTAIKNQGQCGSCWAFSTTGSLEGAHFIKTGKLVSLSEQQLVDCDNKSGDQGCNGGLMDNAFGFIKKNNGLCTEQSYPYKATKGTCKKTCTPVPHTRVSKFTDVDSTETAMLSAVTQQPVSVAIEADQSAFQFYKSGVFSATCGNRLDHGVLNVGYGTMAMNETVTKKSQNDYWKVKNSWGPSWGMKGFILLQRGKFQKQGGQCGILKSGSFPTVN